MENALEKIVAKHFELRMQATDASDYDYLPNNFTTVKIKITLEDREMIERYSGYNRLFQELIKQHHDFVSNYHGTHECADWF